MARRLQSGGAVFWVVVLLVVAGGFAGFRIGKAHFDNRSLVKEVSSVAESLITFRRETPGTPQERVADLLRVLDVYMDPEDVSVSFNDDRDQVRIRFSYVRDVDLVVTNYPARFDVDVERKGARAVGVIRETERRVKDAYETGAGRYE